MAAPRRFQRGANFHRMVPVVVNYCEVVDDAFDGKPAPHSGKFFEAYAYQFRRHV